MRKALDGPIWFTEPQFDHAAEKPRRRQVRINQQCSVNERRAIIEISDDIGERVSGGTEDVSIVLAQLHSASGQPSSFGNLLLWVDDPAKRLAPGKTICGCGIRGWFALARSISACWSLGAIAPTTLAVTSSCNSKTSFAEKSGSSSIAL